jgi:hypothetical protein
LAVASLLLLCCTKNFAQQRDVRDRDSLLWVISDSKISDEHKIEAMSLLAVDYCSNLGDSAKSAFYLKEANKLVEKNFHSAYKIYPLAAELELEEYEVNKIYDLIEEIGAEINRTSLATIKAYGYSVIGNKKIYLLDYQGIDDVYKAISIMLDEKDSPEKFNLLYKCYLILCKSPITRDGVKKRDYMYKLIKWAEETEDLDKICTAKQILSTAYAANYTDSKLKTFRDSSLLLKNQIYDIIAAYPDKIKTETFIVNRIGLAEDYLNFEHNLEMTEQYVNEALPYLETSNNLSERIQMASLNYFINMAQKNYGGAEKSVLDCIDYIENTYFKTEKTNFRYQRIIWTLYSILGNLYVQTGQMEKAITAKDKAFLIYRQYEAEKAMEYEKVTSVKYGLIEKEMALKFANSRNRLYLIITLLSIAAVVFLVMFIIFQTKYLKKKKDEAEARTQLKAIEVERLKKGAIAGNLQIDRKNEVLEQIRKSVKKMPNELNNKKLHKLLKDEINSERNFQDFKTLLLDISPEFYNTLKERAAPNQLTALDMKYCACISLGMSNKDIANALQVGYDTVKVKKSNLKKAFNLDPEIKLNEYLKGLYKE